MRERLAGAPSLDGPSRTRRSPRNLMGFRHDAAASTYLAFLWHAFDAKKSRFRNFMSYDRRWLEEEGSEDSHARALWAVGTVLGRSRNEGYGRLCGLLFKRGLPVVQIFTSPRAWAVALLAIHEYLRRFNWDRLANATRDKLTEKLLTLWHSSASEDWPWFEPVATYGNAQLSMPHAEAPEIGLKSLRWLCDITAAPAEHFRPIGSPLGRPLRRRDIPLDGDGDAPTYRLLRERTPRRAATIPDSRVCPAEYARPLLNPSNAFS